MYVRLRYRALDVIRNEGDLRITGAFQDVLVHALVSCVAATLAALGIDHDLSRAFAGGQVIANRSALELERTVNRVKDVTERELDLCLGGVQLEYRLLTK